MNFLPFSVRSRFGSAAFSLLSLGLLSFSAKAATPTIPNAIVPIGGKGLVVNLKKYISFPLPLPSTNAVTSNNVLVSSSEGNFVIQLFPTNAPVTVANFLDYVTNGYYDNVFFHRSVTNFVIQTGGYQASGSLPSITNLGTITNEFGISNTRGTVAMALTGSDPNSATSQWFINTADNSSYLDDTNTNGNPPFTVFGRVLGTNGLAVVDKIAKLPTVNLNTLYSLGSQFTTVPLQGWSSGGVNFNNLVTITKVQQVSLPYVAASTSDTNAFTASIQGNNLIVTPLAPSTAPVTISILVTDTNGNAATPTFQVSTGKLRQTIDFPVNETPYSTAAYTFNNYSNSAYADYPSSSAGLGVGATITSGPAYVSNGQLFFKGTGVVTLTARSSGNFFYPPASATGHIIVDRGSQTISFPSIANQTNVTFPYTFKLTNYPTSSAGLPVKVSVLSGPAILSGKSLRITGSGTVTLTASQVGNHNYYSATPVTNSFTVTITGIRE